MSLKSLSFKLLSIVMALSFGIASPEGLAAVPGRSFTVGTEDGSQLVLRAPVIARSESGAFVIVYVLSNSNINTTYARLYSASGQPVGSAFQVGVPTWNGLGASVAMDSSGAFSIVWQQPASGDSLDDAHVVIQRYSSDGTPIGNLIDVGAAPSKDGSFLFVGSQKPMIAMDHSGNIAVAWTTIHTLIYNFSTFQGSEWSKSYAALYKSDGSLLKAVGVVDSVAPKAIDLNQPANANELTGLGMDADGDAVMTFNVDRGATATTAVRLFKANLSRKGGLKMLTDVKTYAGLGVDRNGNFAVEWTEPADYSLHVSLYAKNASLLNSIGPIETPDSTTRFETPTLAMAPSGAFAVTWSGKADNLTVGGNSMSNYEKHGQYYQADGTPNGAAFLIDAGSANARNQYGNWLGTGSAVDAHNHLVAVWNADLISDDGMHFTENAVVGRIVVSFP